MSAFVGNLVFSVRLTIVWILALFPKLKNFNAIFAAIFINQTALLAVLPRFFRLYFPSPNAFYGQIQSTFLHKAVSRDRLLLAAMLSLT
jgi:hypothetical protein